jgi:hypothetical protein
VDFGKWFNEAQTFSKTMGKHVLFLFAAQQKGNILAYFFENPIESQIDQKLSPKNPIV